MATVQPTPPAGPGGGSLPPNLTQQGVKEIYFKFQQLKSQGAGEENPEFVKLRSILSTIQQQHQFRNRQQQFAQQQQQQQQQVQQQQQQQQQQVQQQLRQQPPPPQQPQQSAQRQQNNAVGQPNGFNGVTTSAPASSGQTIPAATSSAPSSTSQAKAAVNPSNTQPPAARNATQIAPPPSKPMATSSNSFTGEQLAILRHQIMAFKILTKNLSVPPAIQQQIFPSQQAKRPPSAGQAVAAAGHTLDQASQEQSSAVPDSIADKVESEKQRNSYETFTSPYSHLRKQISYAEHGHRASRLMIPSIMPSGVDIDRVREERERIVYNRIIARKAELEKLPANLASWDTRKSDTPNGDDSTKLKALLEYKMLCLLPKQRALRQQVSRDMVQYDNLAMTANRSMYRRMKKQSLREARITEKLEKQQRDARENREKKKHVDYLQAVLAHGREIQSAASNQKARVQKLGRMMISHHQHIEKEEQKRVERTAKQRLQALKANDEEAYLKLLGQAKDTRISHLLKQTDGFLNQLAASVKQQQREAAERYGDIGHPDDDVDEDDEDEEDIGKKIDYYQVAHRIREEIKVQPNLLVGGTLKEYQVKGLQWMISLYNNNLNGILADEMGLGKTIQTISLITYLIEKKKQMGPFLVIVPLSTLTNWNLEFEKWAPSVTRVVYKGPPNARKQQQQAIRWGNFQVLLTTYEFIIKDRPVLSKIKWVHMIVDEGHRMKNSQSKLSSTLTQYYTTRYRLILTGTPLQNNLPELWALLNFVLPTIFKSVKSFDEWFNTPFANTGGQDKMELTEEEQLLVIRRLHKVLRPFLLRRLKKDVEKDLPEKQERVIKCVFSALQAKLYKQMVTDQRIMVGDGKGGKTGIRGLSNMLMQLRKLCNHPYVFTEVEDQINPSKSIDDSIWRTAGKFELLDRVLPKFQISGHRVLMFFQMTNIMNIMEDYMRLRGMQYLRLDGTTKSDDRSELLRLFNAPQSPYFCFLLSTRAGGLGLNLQTADTVIIFDSDWNPHQDLQAQDRAHRIGQKNEVRILRLISSNSVEEKILERAQYKLDMDGKVIQAGKFDNKSTNEEREQLLRTFMESAEATESLDQEEMDDDDLNLIMARSDAELERFKELDIERAKDSPYGPGKEFPRLLCDAELPDIYLNDRGPVVEEVEEIAGRGARQRTQVKYDDGLTEEQWLDAVDADDDTIEEAVARKQAALSKRQVNKDRKARVAAGTEDPSMASDGENSDSPAPKKRGRKPKPMEKRKVDEAALDELQPANKRKRGRTTKSSGGPIDSLGTEERAALQRALLSVYNALMDLEAPTDSEDDEDSDKPGKRPIIEPFKKVPPKTFYPDYYMIIQNPIAMDMIKKKINKEDYSSLREFRDDVRTLCTNARTYNEDGSMLFQDANTIEMACVEKLKEAAERYPEIADLDELTSSVADGQSTGPISSVNTPRASSVGAGKLKLTFNNANLSNGGGTNGKQSDDEDE
ncbi:MAG: hypothetical protein M1837_005631 [Sclerophora amabilis]|nr:MAG: hypothetical protein M1837_005631 [Sclerophora amabilis]